MLNLDLIQTVAFSGIVLFVGYALCRFIRPFSRYNIPAPVVGGLLVALAILVARHFDVTLLKFDITLRDPLMIAFFTTIGFGASLSLLRVGGPQVFLFFVIATVAAVLQNVVGGLIALLWRGPSILRPPQELGRSPGGHVDWVLADLLNRPLHGAAVAPSGPGGYPAHPGQHRPGELGGGRSPSPSIGYDHGLDKRAFL
jgi:hypothetical protein